MVEEFEGTISTVSKKGRGPHPLDAAAPLPPLSPLDVCLMSNTIPNKFTILKPVSVMRNYIIYSYFVYLHGLKFVTKLVFLGRAYEYEAGK